MPRLDLPPCQIANPLLHLRGHVWLQRLILGRQHEQDVLLHALRSLGLSILEEILQLVEIIDLAIPIPVQRPMESMPRILLGIVVQLGGTQQLRHAELRQVFHEDARVGVEGNFAAGPARAVHAVEERLDLSAGLERLLELARGEVLLVPEIREPLLDQDVQGLVDGGGREVGRADGEDVRDEARMVLGCAVDDGAAPGEGRRLSEGF